MNDVTQGQNQGTNRTDLPAINKNSSSGSAATTVGAAQPGLAAAADALFDIQVNVSIVVGQRQMKLKDIMKLCRDSVVELDKTAGDPLDILVNGSLIAHGEIVVTNEKYGIRITEIASDTNRFNGSE